MLCNQLLNDMANEFVTHVISTTEGNPVYTSDEINALSKLRARVATEAAKMKDMNEEAWAHFRNICVKENVLL